MSNIIIDKYPTKFREPDNIFPSSLSSSEQNILALMLSEISRIKGIAKQKSIPVELPTIFNFSEKLLMEVFKCKKKNIKATIEPVANKLINKKIGYSDSKGFATANLISYVNYQVGGEFSIHTIKFIVDLLSNYSGFSEVDFKLFVSMPSKASKRLFREINRWKHIERHPYNFMSIPEYKELIGVAPEHYAEFKDLKRYRITPIFNQIITLSDGLWVPTDKEKLGYELRRSGRGYSAIKICLKYTGMGDEENLTVTDALLTYEKLVKKETDTFSSNELSNLEKNIPNLVMEGVAFSPDFAPLFKNAKANANISDDE